MADFPEVTIPKTAARASQDECLKRSGEASRLAFFDRALDWADQAIVADPRKQYGWAAKAEALFGLKRFPEAVAHGRKVVEINPKFAEAWSRLATFYEAADSTDLALEAWDKTVALAERSVLHWTGRGLCLSKMGRLEEALASHLKALELDPRFAPGHFHLGRVQAGLGQKESAIASLQKFLAQAPPNLPALAQEARTRLQELKA